MSFCFSFVSPSLYLSLSLPLLFNLMFPETCHLQGPPYCDRVGFLEDKKKENIKKGTLGGRLHAGNKGSPLPLPFPSKGQFKPVT